MNNKFELHTHFTKAVSDEEGVLRIKGYANTTTKDRMGGKFSKKSYCLGLP